MRARRGGIGWSIGALAVFALTPALASAADGDVLLEFHFQPVPGAQIAVWLEDADGNFVQDVFVTQATGTLGIGNRPGRWDFLSSWRFPYGPRPGVLPVWAHARDITYPKLVFHDDNPADHNSLGWHENSSSPEPYFCRPLTGAEHETISTDTLTCPSPAVFQSDKGKFSDNETSVYPPRSDLVEFETDHDHADVRMFSELNDLDAVTRATPAGYVPELVTAMLPADVAEQGPLVARIEIHIEDDQNGRWAYDREDDHYVDPRLASFGIPYLGQPSVVYDVTLDPTASGFTSTDMYAGYGDLVGESGDLNPPDDSISTEDSSGADRLQLYTLNERTFRFGVYSHGTDGGEAGEGTGWGSCQDAALPPMTDVDVEAIDFDRVRVHFTVPHSDADISTVRLYYRQGDAALTGDTLSSAIQQVPSDEDCGEPLAPGVTTWCEIDELFGSTNYQVGVRYEDRCANSSDVTAMEVTTPQQDFAVVEGFCFVATAAYGAPWENKVQALRWVRDRYLERSPLGKSMVDFYYYASPPAARLIARSDFAREMARQVLGPVAELAELATASERGSWGQTRRVESR